MQNMILHGQGPGQRASEGLRARQPFCSKRFSPANQELNLTSDGCQTANASCRKAKARCQNAKISEKLSISHWKSNFADGGWSGNLTRSLWLWELRFVARSRPDRDQFAKSEFADLEADRCLRWDGFQRLAGAAGGEDGAGGVAGGAGSSDGGAPPATGVGADGCGGSCAGSGGEL